MDNYARNALKSAMAKALMNNSNTLEETDLCIAIIHLTKSDPTFLLDVDDGKPALFIFMKDHKAHLSGPRKEMLFSMLKDRTLPDMIYHEKSMHTWYMEFERILGPISPS